VSKKISQVEARSLRHQVRRLQETLNAQKRSWSQDWPGGTHLGTVTVNGDTRAVVHTARRLGHAVVVTYLRDSQIELYALELPK
jgi:hypothetical protein